MKKFFLIALVGLCQFVFAQDKGTVSGTVSDKEMNSEPLPFANVFIKGTSIGGTTDLDGKYTISVGAGNHTLVFSFVGYQTIEKPITVVAGKTLSVNQLLGASGGEELEEVQINATVSKEKESALLLQQKKATVIKESIGAQELSKKGVSDAATATTKISGVTKSEGTGDIYIRGLGDRYLSTTMNGLPIPSNDVNNKNIDLGLFSTNILQNVGISKTYVTSNYSDLASGSVDVVSKRYSKKGITIGLKGGANTSVLDLNGDFKRTIIYDDAQFGFQKNKFALVDQILNQGWDTKKAEAPYNYGLSLSGSHKFKLFGKDLSFIANASYSKSHSYRTGIFEQYRGNFIKDRGFNDTENYKTNDAITGYFNTQYKLNNKNKVSYTSLFINNGQDNLYEQGRNRQGLARDEEPSETGVFVRDQNFVQTTLIVNQLNGEHKISKNDKLTWAGGYNYVLAKEPNRIRNEVVILDDTTVEYANTSFFQQRKSKQKIKDKEYNGLVQNEWSLGSNDEYDNKPYKLNFGVNFRSKKRNFNNQFIGVKSVGFQTNSIDNLSFIFIPSGFNNGLERIDRKPDLYEADLLYYAGFVNFDFKFDNNLSGNLGLRYENNDINVIWNVSNSPDGIVNKNYESLYPSVNLKYEINETNFIRFASSITQTLPEFKEIAPFEYVSPTGRVSKGNQDIEKSDVYNIDLKYEIFPSRSELISFAAFYKKILNPINLTQTRGSSGNLFYANTGEEANILGLELEGKYDILKNEDDLSTLSATANITKMWLNQDLLPNFRYNNKIESDLQGASDLIVNASISFNDQKEKPFIATLTGNYSSDKIFALGSQEDFVNQDLLFNNEIIEKGFITLDFVASKELFKDFTLKLTGRNLLNPEVEQVQLLQEYQRVGTTDRTLQRSENRTVSSYKNGIQLTLGLNYKF